MTAALELNALEQLAAERQLAATVDNFWQCMDTLRDKRLLEPMAGGTRTVEGSGVTNFWLDRPTLVTGATGLLGGWMVRVSWISGGRGLFGEGLGARITTGPLRLIDKVRVARRRAGSGTRRRVSGI